MARLDHPNIVRVYGGCMSPPNLFVVEEIMVGDLASHIHRREKTGQGPLTLQMVLELALDIIRGLVSEEGYTKRVVDRRIMLSSIFHFHPSYCLVPMLSFLV